MGGRVHNKKAGKHMYGLPAWYYLLVFTILLKEAGVK